MATFAYSRVVGMRRPCIVEDERGIALDLRSYRYRNLRRRKTWVSH